MSKPLDRAKSVFLSALEVPDGEARRVHVATACGGDLAVQREVSELLRHHVAESVFLEPGLPAETSDLAPGGSNTGGASVQPGLVLVGRYKLVEEIGAGGMGTVWMAQQTEPVRRPVAVKLVKAGMDTRAVLGRFEAERQALALMDHPNIAKVLDAGETADGRPFFVMELVRGVSITKFCDDRQLTVCERLGLFVSVCQAVQHAHQKGVIHRDLKPSNVLVALYDETPVPKVIDFGIAKATGQPLTDRTLMTGYASVVGTPEYMSPEQASFNNLDVDTRSDVYALGVLLYELLAGTPPFGDVELRRAGLLEFLRIVREVDPPLPSHKLSTCATLPVLATSRRTEPARLAASLRGELDWVVMKALEKDRSRRYETADALARDVRRFLADEVVEARPPSRGYLLRKFVRRHRGQVLGGMLVLIALIAGIVGTTTGLLHADRQRLLAEQAAEQERLARDREAEQRAGVVAARAALRRTLTRQMADRLQADMMRLAAIGEALATTVKQGHKWNERQFIDWMTPTLEREPEILGLCIAFEPGRFDPVLDPATVREPFHPLLPLGIDALDPFRDGYSLYVSRQNNGTGGTPVAAALKREYRYRTQPWYANTLRGGARGWEEPTPDLYGPMVAYAVPLDGPGEHPIGALCVDLSVVYFDRLDAWLRHPNFGAGSYGFVLSPQGKVVSHPHVQRTNKDPFPQLKDQQGAFVEPVGLLLAHAGDDVGELTAVDPATRRRSQFLVARFKPANWLFVAVIPEDD